MRNGSADIYFNRSLDGGATWLSSDVRLDKDPPGAANSTAAQIAASGPSVYVAWEDSRNGSTDIYFNRSLDGGATWLDFDVRLNTGATGSAENPRITTSGSAVYVTWDEPRNGSEGIYINRSLDGGATWLVSDIRLDTRPPGSDASQFPEIAASGPSVYVAWADKRDSIYSDIYFNRSLDRGATWLGSDVRLDRTPLARAVSLRLQIAASGSSVYVTWDDSRNSFSDIYFNRSLDGGATWLGDDVRLDSGSGNSNRPQIAASGSSVYVTWLDGRNRALGTVYFNRSLDGGATWLGTDVRLDRNLDRRVEGFPEIAASGSSVYVAWEDGRNGSSIYFNRSLDSGANWLSADVRLDSKPPAPFSFGIAPQIAVSGSSVYVTWNDLRNGTTYISASDIFFNIPFGSLPYGIGKEGSGGFVPRLAGTDSLNLGSTYSLVVSDGPGSAHGCFGFGFGPASKASLPAFGGTLLVDPFTVLIPFVLDGELGVPGAGSLSFDIPIPANVSLLGFNLNAQAGLFDPGATFGVSMTNGVEAWIL